MDAFIVGHVLSVFGKLLAWAAKKVFHMTLIPKLALEYNPEQWPRCYEYVLADMGVLSLWSPPLTGAPMTPDNLTNALYVRVYLKNLRRLWPAGKCRVYVERIHHNGKLIESESSELNWTDVDSFNPLSIDAGNGKYADVCSVYRETDYLQVHSVKGRKGYGRLPKAGVYSLEISSRDGEYLSKDAIRMEIQCGQASWNDLRVIRVVRLSKGTESLIWQGEAELVR
jgi:hypothetical protein